MLITIALGIASTALTSVDRKSVKHASIQVGGKGSSPGDVHARFEQDVHIGKLRTHLTARFRHPNENRLLDTVSLSGMVGDVGYEATRVIGGDDSTDMQLAYALPSGIQLTAVSRARVSNARRVAHGFGHVKN